MTKHTLTLSKHLDLNPFSLMLAQILSHPPCYFLLSSRLLTLIGPDRNHKGFWGNRVCADVGFTKTCIKGEYRALVSII